MTFNPSVGKVCWDGSRSLDKAVVHVLMELSCNKEDGVCVLCGPGTLGTTETLRSPAGNPQGTRDSQRSEGVRDPDHVMERDTKARVGQGA